MSATNRDLFGLAEPETVRHIDGPRLDLVLHFETQTGERDYGAILVSTDGHEPHAAWLPKREIEIFRGTLTHRAIQRNGQVVRLPVVTVTVPEGLAREKGLMR